MQLSISFIGSGRVATQLASILAQHVTIKQIFSRNLQHAEKLAQRVGSQGIDQIANLQAADVLIIAVSDRAIADLADNLATQHYAGLVLHTSGSTDIQVLQQKDLRAGVFYPLQTFSFDKDVDWQSTPIFIEATQPQDLEHLQNLASIISKTVYRYSSEQRLALHLAAVFACNFSNYCYDIAQQILNQHQVDVHLLQSLIDETAHKLQFFSAFQNQTGPAVRHDHNILSLHQQMLEDDPQWQEIYHLMSAAIQKRHPQ